MPNGYHSDWRIVCFYLKRVCRFVHTCASFLLPYMVTLSRVTWGPSQRRDMAERKWHYQTVTLSPTHTHMLSLSNPLCLFWSSGYTHMHMYTHRHIKKNVYTVSQQKASGPAMAFLNLPQWYIDFMGGETGLGVWIAYIQKHLYEHIACTYECIYSQRHMNSCTRVPHTHTHTAA